MDILKKEELKKLIDLRKELHMHPEIGFEEFETRERIEAILIELGVKPEQMHRLEPTALYVDLQGQAEPSGQPRCIAFRADMDALLMQEANQHLEYRSKNHGKAHMCGHDGHITCLVAFVPLFLRKACDIPSDKKIRLLFQPSEEGPKSGAEKMVHDGCLDGVDEVYGLHQLPGASMDQLWCKEGPVMSEATILEITIIGTGGHGSEPEKLKEAVPAAVKFYQKAMDYLSVVKEKNQGKLVCTLPIFQGGERFNVISDRVFISGSIRSFVQKLNQQIVKELTCYLEQLKAEGFDYKFRSHITAPINSNTKEEAQHVLRVGRKVFGKDNVGAGVLPIRASEDFGYFTAKKPGAYFFLPTGIDQPMSHNNNFDFNDKLIPKAAAYWYHLALDRLDIKCSIDPHV